MSLAFDNLRSSRKMALVNTSDHLLTSERGRHKGREGEREREREREKDFV